MKGSQKIQLSTIIKRVVAITALLALIEVAFIYFYMNNKNSKKALAKNETKKTLVDSLKDTEPTVKYVPPVEAPKQQQTEATDTIITEAIAPVQQKTEAVIAAPQKTEPVVIAKQKPEVKNPDTIKKKALPTPAVVKYVQRQLTQQEMTKLLTEINDERTRLNNQTKCVQIRKTQSSNIDNGFEIATFLKQNGFIISGREVVGSTIEGILIDASASCIKLTIGSL